MPAPERVAAVVLAAGTSSRMGKNKLLLELGGQSLVRRAVGAAIEAGLDPVIVVIGHEAERVRAEVEGLPCLMLVNPDFAEGVRSSLQAGVTQAATAAGALVVVLADMPFVTAPMIASLVERYRATGAPLVVSQYGDVDAPPILYDHSLFGELLAIPEDRCAKQVVRRHRGQAQVITWPVEALRDVDVAEDYEQIRASLAARPDAAVE